MTKLGTITNTRQLRTNDPIADLTKGVKWMVILVWTRDTGRRLGSPRTYASTSGFNVANRLTLLADRYIDVVLDNEGRIAKRKFPTSKQMLNLISNKDDHCRIVLSTPPRDNSRHCSKKLRVLRIVFTYKRPYILRANRFSRNNLESKKKLLFRNPRIRVWESISGDENGLVNGIIVRFSLASANTLNEDDVRSRRREDQWK